MKQINPRTAFDGDILKVTENVFDDTIKAGIWSKNFISRTRFYKIIRATNNGGAVCKRSDGSTILFYLANPAITAAYRREV